MRRQDHVGKTLQRRREALLVRSRFLREHIDRRAAQSSFAQGRRQRLEIDDSAPAVVDEIGAGFHPRDLGRTDHVVSRRRLRDVEADDVALLQQFVERLDRLGIAVPQLVGEIVEDHLHAHGFGEIRQLRADIAVADDAQRLAANLKTVVGGLVPAAVMRRDGAGDDPPQQHDDLADHQFGDGTGVREGRVEDRHAAPLGGVEIDLVRADAEAADRDKAWRGGEDRFGQMRARPDAEDMDAFERRREFRAVERGLQAGDVGVAGVRHQIDGAVVDAFEQEDLDRFAGL